MAASMMIGSSLALAACSSTPVYTADQACSLDTSVVSDLLGSDRFVADEAQLVGTPVTTGAPGLVLCSADRDDNKVIVTARAVDAATVDVERAKAAEEATRYEYRGGFGYLRDDAVVWTCGVVTASIRVREVPDADIDWERLGHQVWDQLGCLTIDDSGEAVQPDGWA